MLCIYCLQQWYNLSGPGAENALYDIQSTRAFCGLDLGRDPIPDAPTILNFHHLLERHELTKGNFAAVSSVCGGMRSMRQRCLSYRFGMPGRTVVPAPGCLDSGIPLAWRAWYDRPSLNFLPDLSKQHIEGIARTIRDRRGGGHCRHLNSLGLQLGP
jgi:hypothetical protein